MKLQILRKIVNTKNDKGESLGIDYHLIKSFKLPVPDNDDGFLPDLSLVDDFTTEFKGASEQFCRD